MFTRILLAVILACASLFAFALPNHRANALAVSVAMSDRTTVSDGQVVVDLAFTNTGDTPLSVVRWFMPDGEPEGDLFLLTRNGEAVAYLGPIIKRPAPTVHDMITLAPGESISRSADLSELYDLTESGVYAIRYGAASAQMFGRAAAQAQLKRGVPMDADEGVATVFSNETSAYLAGRRSALLDIATGSTALTKSVSFSGRCSVAEENTIASAVGAAQTMTNGSVSYLNGTPAATSRYTTWFGTFSSANWNEVKGHFTNIKSALDTQPLVFDCKCNKSYYAYVFPTKPYQIFLCRAFWTAPLTGTDSKGGTIIHEMSHFNVVAGTSDYAYGQTAAKALAISNPAQARFNADSHEYFAENTPLLP